MTTLPSTSNPRLPRPAGAAPAISTAGAPPQISGMTGADVWRVLRANSLIIIGLFLFAGVSGYFINLMLLKYNAKYTALGYVQITPTRMTSNFADNNEGGLDVGTLQVDLKTQAQFLKSEGLFNSVLQDSNEVRETPWFKNFVKMEKGADGTVLPRPDIAAAKESLAESYVAMPVVDSKLIAVTMTCKDRESAKTIVEAIVTAHLNTQQDIARDRIATRSQNINQAKTKLLTRINQLNTTIRQQEIDLSNSGFNSPSTFRASGSPKEQQLTQLIFNLSTISRDLAEAKSSAEEFENAIKAGGVPPQVTQLTTNDPQIVNLQYQVTQLRTALSQYTDQLGPKHTAVQKLQNQLTAAETEMENTRGEKQVQYTESFRSQLTSAINRNQATTEQYTKQIEDLKSEMGELSYKAVQYLVNMDEIRAYQEQQKLLDKQLDTIAANIIRDLAGVDWAQRPQTPEAPSFPRLPVTLGVALALGLLSGLGIAFTREFLDQTVRSPRDLARVGQLSLLGMIPHEDDDPQSAGVPLPLAIFQAPNGIIAENYRQVRTRLQHMTSLDTTRSLLITSPGPDDGKSTVACNLAAGLALNGRKILLVDANFRKPSIHKIFALNNDTGFSSVLAAPENYSTFIRQTSVPNLDVLPTGPKPANPTELLESSLLNDFIERALAEYDHVIFDSGPLLLVSETVALAPRVDGVITVIRASTNSRGLLARMRDGLRQVKAEHIGVVLNAVKAQGGGYYGRSIKDYYAYQNGHKH